MQTVPPIMDEVQPQSAALTKNTGPNPEWLLQFLTRCSLLFTHVSCPCYERPDNIGRAGQYSIDLTMQ